ncbi:PAS domain-containing protein [bacterium]|nr:PAS domain-containing protein [bacterium]
MLWRYSVIAVAAAAILGGALLTMGQLRSREADYTQAELAKLKAMSSVWETRLTSVRAAFRDQVWRHDLTQMLEHPEDWTNWRAEEKLRTVQDSWINDFGTLRGFGFFDSSRQLHTALGDTSGLAAAKKLFHDTGNPDMIVSEQRPGITSYVAVRYSPAVTDESQHPGELILLIERESVLRIPDTAPRSWMLMDGPQSPLYASTASLNAPFQKATWNILMSKESGIVPHSNGIPFGFTKLQVPGMFPMLLLTEIQVPSTSADTTGAMILIAGGALLLALILAPVGRRKPADLTAFESGEQTPKTGETVTFRQVFQAVRQPLCVIDSQGLLMRVNSACRTLLNVQKGGKPDGSIEVSDGETAILVHDFLASIAAEPHDYNGPITLTLKNSTTFQGTINATRLYTDKAGRGPVMIEFNAATKTAQTDAQANLKEETSSASVVDNKNPEPLILVGADGIIREYNEAAVKACDRIKDTPLLADILPGIERRELPEMLASTKDERFDSLFGSSTHEFRAIHTEQGILLYGHRQTDETSLTIALEQAQESFNSLCSMTPSAVLLIDPWTHSIRSANAGAAELFAMTPFDLQEQCLDDFTDIPWEEPEQEKDIMITLANGSLRLCRFSHDLIKIEGEPTVLAVLTPQHMPVEADVRDLAEHAQAMAGALQDQLTESVLPLGPGLLIVNNPTVREVARRMLAKTGHPCEAFSSLDDATAWIYSHDLRPELVCFDLGDFDDGDEWLTQVRTRCGDVPCLALSSGNDYPLPDNGPNYYLEKPFELESLAQALLALNIEIESEVEH